MEFYDLLRKRYSARKYLPKKVESTKLAQILEAARIAPTAKNLQPIKIIVCDNEESLGKLSKAANIYGAPMHCWFAVIWTKPGTVNMTENSIRILIPPLSLPI